MYGLFANTEGMEAAAVPVKANAVETAISAKAASLFNFPPCQAGPGPHSNCSKVSRRASRCQKDTVAELRGEDSNLHYRDQNPVGYPVTPPRKAGSTLPSGSGRHPKPRSGVFARRPG